jgi:hypothetical protein
MLSILAVLISAAPVLAQASSSPATSNSRANHRSHEPVTRTYDLSFAFADIDLESRRAQQAGAALIHELTNTVAPGSWHRDDGIFGGPGTAQIFRGQLIVSQTPDVQDTVQSFVAALRDNAATTLRAYDVHDLVGNDPAGVPFVRSRMDQLIDAIQATCGRDTWRELSGMARVKKGSIWSGKSSTLVAFEGKLFVTASPAVQRQIETFLAAARKKD